VRSYLAAGKNEEALNAARNAEAHFQSLDDKNGEASALGVIAGIFASMGDLDQAIIFHRQALSIHKEVQATVAEARSMQALAFVFLTKGDRREAISITAELAALTNAAPEPELKGIALKLHAHVLMALADRWPRDGHEYAVAAVDASERALELTLQSDDLAGQALSTEVLAKALKFVGRFEEARVAAGRALALHKEAGVTGAPLASSLICSAQSNVAAKKMYSAMWDAKKALVHATASKDAALQKSALSLIEEIGRSNQSLAGLGIDVRRM
jgi:tetratricopeptide (TPR) repeat protein